MVEWSKKPWDLLSEEDVKSRKHDWGYIKQNLKHFKNICRGSGVYSAHKELFFKGDYKALDDDSLAFRDSLYHGGNGSATSSPSFYFGMCRGQMWNGVRSC